MKLEGWGKGKKLWIAITIGIVITIVLLIVILAFTVLKPNKLMSTVDNISIKDMDMGFDIFTLTLTMNVTLEVDVSVKNPNKFGLKYHDGIAQLNYRGLQIGDVPIPNGDISAGETKGMNVTLSIMADRIDNVHFPSDFKSGKLPLNTFTKIYGEVIVLGFIKFRVDSTSSCDFVINIPNQTVENDMCQFKTKV